MIAYNITYTCDACGKKVLVEVSDAIHAYSSPLKITPPENWNCLNGVFIYCPDHPISFLKQKQSETET